MRAILSVLGLSIVLYSTVVAAEETTTTFEWQSCVQLDTVVAGKSACYIKDIATGKGRIEIGIAVGVNVKAGSVLINGGGHSWMLAKITIPITDKDDKEKLIEDAIRKHLKDKESQAEILKLINKNQGRSPDTEVKIVVPEKIEVKESTTTYDKIKKGGK